MKQVVLGEERVRMNEEIFAERRLCYRASDKATFCWFKRSCPRSCTVHLHLNGYRNEYRYETLCSSSSYTSLEKKLFHRVKNKERIFDSLLPLINTGGFSTKPNSVSIRDVAVRRRCNPA